MVELSGMDWLSIIWAKRPRDGTLLSNKKRPRKQPLAV